jgi:hypothetical protein
MTNNEELRKAARALVELGNQKQVAEMLAHEHNQMLHEREMAKTHPLQQLRLSDEEWGMLRAHMIDGGGVEDRHQSLHDGPSLNKLFWQSLVVDGDQAAFWDYLPHIIKSLAKAEGMVRPLANGGVTFGALSTKTRGAAMDQKGEK